MSIIIRQKRNKSERYDSGKHAAMFTSWPRDTIDGRDWFRRARGLLWTPAARTLSLRTIFLSCAVACLRSEQYTGQADSIMNHGPLPQSIVLGMLELLLARGLSPHSQHTCEG